MIKSFKLFFQKYRRREFWPSYIADIPVYFYRLYLSIKAGHILFFSNINPGMIFSGFSGNSKYKEIQRFPQYLTPKTIFLTANENEKDIIQKIKKNQITYPCIAKPDLGRTGRDIQKLHNDENLKAYIDRVQEDIIIQEFIDYPLEFGIMYYRLPTQSKGHITGITEKCFMFLQGDGKHTIHQLIMKHPRAKFYYKSLKKEHEDKRENILLSGEKFQLNYIGNHCRGSTFYDRTYLSTPQLEKVIDQISQMVPGFYLGRYDIKVQSLEDLYAGNFKIIELNGMGSLPVHNLDPKYGMRDAYKILFDHRRLTYQVSQINYKNGHKYLPIKKAIAIVKKYGI